MTPTTAASLQPSLDSTALDPRSLERRSLEDLSAPTDPAEIRAARNWLADRLRGLARSVRSTQRSEIRVLAIPAPMGEPEGLLEVQPGPYGVFWHPPAGPATAGVGVARRLDLGSTAADTRAALETLRLQADGLWGRLESEGFEGADAPVPRLFGGVAFTPAAADAEPWREFGAGCFTLPRWTYRRGETAATLSLAVDLTQLESSGSVDGLLAELDQVLSRLASPPPPAPTRPRVLDIDSPGAELEAQVQSIRDAIAHGALSKVVAARSSRVVLADALETADVLRRLSRGLRASVRFAFGRQQTTFLGATPERLISRRGRRIETEALAGSIASGGEHAAELLGSPKDGREHQLVVDEIVRCLRPLCDRFEVPAEPRIRELRDVLHLHTPVHGRLAAPHHVLDLVARLHPTPAVGGVPTADALDWIRRHESEARGWYAAPVGWFDAAGDGDFAVALRSCVLRDREAFLFAGAGIVQDSDPRLEVQEIELKKQALLTALGA